MILRDPAIRRRAILGVSVMILAFSAGHIMQNVLARDTDLAVRGLTPDAGPVVHEGTRAPGLPVPPAATLTPFQAPDFTPGDRITDDPPLPELPLEDASAVPMGRALSHNSRCECRRRRCDLAGGRSTMSARANGQCRSWMGCMLTGGLTQTAAFGRSARAVCSTKRDVAFCGWFGRDSFFADARCPKRVPRGLTWDGPQILGLMHWNMTRLMAARAMSIRGLRDRLKTDGSRGFLMQLGDGPARWRRSTPFRAVTHRGAALCTLALKPKSPRKPVGV